MSEMRSKLRKKRLEKGLSQHELAYKVGVTRQTISDIERCKLNPSVRLLKALCDVLGLAMEAFFCVSGVGNTDKCVR